MEAQKLMLPVSFMVLVLVAVRSQIQAMEQAQNVGKLLSQIPVIKKPCLLSFIVLGNWNHHPLCPLMSPRLLIFGQNVEAVAGHGKKSRGANLQSRDELILLLNQ